MNGLGGLSLELNAGRSENTLRMEYTGIPDLQPTPIIIKQFCCASVSHRPQFLMALAHQVID
jgi:hypothetical protein